MNTAHPLRVGIIKPRTIRQKIKARAAQGFWVAFTPWLRWVGRRKKVSVTCDRWDGGGAQWHARLSTMAFCRFFGFTYFHTDIESLLPIDSAELRKKWSGLIIGESEPANQRPSIRPNPSTLLVFLLKLAIGQFTSNTFVLSVNHCHAFTDFFPQQIEALICDGKLKYANPKKLEVNQSAAIPSLAIHLRRGHMLPSDEGLRLTTNQMILDTLTVLTTQYGPLKTTIYSAIPDTELESMLPLGVILNSSADEFDVLHNLITADYMVMAKSSMSYVAGVFCQGIVFYEPFWHPPLSSWKKLPTRASRSEMQ